MDNQKDMQNTQYNLEQNEEIQKGLEQGLDVSVYADPEYNLDQQAWNPAREELFESIAYKAVEKFKALDAGDRDTLVSLYQEQFNSYLKKLAINEVLDFDHMQPVEDAITAIVDTIDLDNHFNNVSEYGGYDVNVTHENDQGIPTSFEISFDNWEAADEDHREWRVSFDLTEDTVKAITEAKMAYEHDAEEIVDDSHDPYMLADTEIIGAIFEQIDGYNYENETNLDPYEVCKTAAEYLMGSSEIRLDFPKNVREELDEKNGWAPRYNSLGELTDPPSRWAARDVADVILDAYALNLDRSAWVENETLSQLATPLAKMQSALEAADYNFETHITSHVHQTASMTIEPKHQYKDAKFQINVKDIDLTGNDLHAKGQLMINDVAVTPETIDEIRQKHDKIITRTEQIMKMINSPEHDKEMLQMQDINKNR